MGRPATGDVVPAAWRVIRAAIPVGHRAVRRATPVAIRARPRAIRVAIHAAIHAEDRATAGTVAAGCSRGSATCSVQSVGVEVADDTQPVAQTRAVIPHTMVLSRFWIKRCRISFLLFISFRPFYCPQV